jgi:hypothetical protein
VTGFEGGGDAIEQGTKARKFIFFGGSTRESSPGDPLF